MIDKKIPVNDGKGLYNNIGLCDTLKEDLNNLIKQAVAGQFLQCSAIVFTMTQKINNLKKGIADDLKSKDEIIEELKQINNSLVEEKTGLPVDKDGGTDGND